MKRICDISECPLGHRPVWGTGPDNPICMLVGEAPGADEDSYGEPFVGKSGQELSMYLKQFTKINRDHFWLDNVVKCHPPGNKDPLVEEIACCDHYLTVKLDELAPRFIGAVGRVATQWFLGKKVTMDKVHGIPFHWEIGLFDTIVIPLYHPAYGLHSPRQMKDVIEDFTALGRVIRGQMKPRSECDIKLNYKLEK